MKCPTCRQETTKLIAHPAFEGLFCPACRDKQKVKGDRNVYTGRKFWSQDKCYTPKQLREANEATAETWTRAAEVNRKKTIRPSILAGAR